MENKLVIGIVGAFQMGKSTLINCLLDDKVAKTGYGISTTKINTRYVFGEYQSVKYYLNDKVVRTSRLCDFLADSNSISSVSEIEVTLWKPFLKHIDIVDTPGFNANEKDNQMALDSLKGLDMVIVLLGNKSLSEPEEMIFEEIAKQQLPYIVIINCNDGKDGDSWSPFSKMNNKIFEDISAQISNKGFAPIKIDGKTIWNCNLWWYWYVSEHFLQDDENKNKKLINQLKMHVNDFENFTVTDHVLIANQSNFLPFRKFFDGLYFGFPINYLKWNSQINQELSNWKNNINNVLNKL